MKKAILLLKRRAPVAGSILGELWLDGVFFCWTLERQDVAIPAHVYQVLLNHSPKFRKLMPQLVGGKVKASWGVRIHTGTSKKDTDGCVLVGFARMPSKTQIYQSQDAFEALMRRLLEYTDIELTIQ